MISERISQTLELMALKFGLDYRSTLIYPAKYSEYRLLQSSSLVKFSRHVYLSVAAVLFIIYLLDLAVLLSIGNFNQKYYFNSALSLIVLQLLILIPGLLIMGIYIKKIQNQNIYFFQIVDRHNIFLVVYLSIYIIITYESNYFFNLLNQYNLNTSQDYNLFQRGVIIVLSYIVLWSLMNNAKFKVLVAILDFTYTFIRILINYNFNWVQIIKSVIYIIAVCLFFIILTAIQERLQLEGFKSYMYEFKNEENWKNIFENIEHGVAVVSKDEKVLHLNNHLKKLFGFQLVQENVFDELLFLLGEIQKPDKLQNEEGAEDYVIEMKKKLNTNNKNLPNSGKVKLKKTFNLRQLLEKIRTQIESNEEKIINKCHLFYTKEFKIKSSISNEKAQLEIKIIPNFRYSGHKNVFLLTFEDISQRQIIQSLRENVEFKTKLISSFSHELKTPLNGAIPPLEICLADSRIPKDLTIYLEKTLRSLQLLKSFLNGIVDFANIQQMQIALKYEPINILYFLNETIQIIKPQAEAKKLPLTIIVDQSINTFNTDFDRLQQIILNLLTNAIKFTLEGKITIRAILTNQALQIITIYIEDTGIGIDDVKLKQIDKLLKQHDFTEDNNVNQTGICLGLVISQNLALLLGPNKFAGIKVMSQLKKGSTFSFQINDKLLSEDAFTEINSMSTPPSMTAVFRSPQVQQKRLETMQMARNGQTMDVRARNLVISTMQNKGQANSPEINRIKKEGMMRLNIPGNLLRDTKNFLKNETLINLHEIGEEKDEADNLMAQSTADNMIESTNEFNNNNNSKVKKLTIKEYNFGEKFKSNENLLKHIPKILVVDDEPFNILSMEMIIKKLGYDCYKAFNGEQAIEILKKEQWFNKQKGRIDTDIKLVFMDYQMPVLNGVETTKILVDLMDKKIVPNIPIVACTAYNSNRDIQNCINAGMIDFINKPISSHSIKICVDKFVLNNKF